MEVIKTVASYAPWPLSRSSSHREEASHSETERQLVLARHDARLGQTLLPDSVATLISQLSVLSRLSLTTSAFVLESLLDAARFSSSASLSLTRHLLISAITTSTAQMSRASSDETALASLQNFSQLGCHYIHSSFSLVELFALSSINLVQSVVQTTSTAAVESVRLVDALFGSTEASRTLASIIGLVRRELAQDPRFKDIGTLTSLTKSLTAFIAVQHATRRRIASEKKTTVLLDAVVLRQKEQKSSTSASQASDIPQPAVEQTDEQRLSDLLSPELESSEIETSDNLSGSFSTEVEAIAEQIRRQLADDTPDDVRIDRRAFLRGSSLVEVETITTSHTKTTIRVVNEESSSDGRQRRPSFVQESSTEEYNEEARHEEWINLAPPAEEQENRALVPSSAGPASSGGSIRKRFQAFKSISERFTKRRRVVREEQTVEASQPAAPNPAIEEVPAASTSRIDSPDPDQQEASSSTVTRERSEHTQAESQAKSFMEQEPHPLNFPRQHIVHNINRYVKFASAAYGQSFLRLLNLGNYTYAGEANHHAFSHHTGIPLNKFRLTSFMEPVLDNSKGENLVHYLTIDDAAQAVVLACRGSLGLSDLLTDLTMDYERVVLPHAPEGNYLAHKGMLKAAQMLVSKKSTVHEAIKQALLDYPSYGLVLVGHSLGAGVCSLLAALFARPSDTPGQYVLNAESGLPEGRPLHSFGFGTPCCASIDLARYCTPFCTTVVHENDFVCTLSLGVLHDLKDLALSLQDNPNLMKDIMSSITGLRSPFSTGEDPASADEQTAEWLWSLRQAMKALSVNDKLLPPGRVLQLETQQMYVASEETDLQVQKEADRVILKSVDDVLSCFGEPTFSKDMLLSHSPYHYERAIKILHAAIVDAS